MKTIQCRVLLFLTCLLLMAGCGKNDVSLKEELLANIPYMDTSACNRFSFTMNLTAGNADGDTEEFNMSGTVEMWNRISHMYGLDISFDTSGYQTQAETWADFDTGERYTDLGDGFRTDRIRNDRVIENLADVINSRSTDMLLSTEDGICTLSWTFPTESEDLFGEILSAFTETGNLNGSGRITAVFDPQTHLFRYFTFVVSTGSEDRSGALLDAIFYWNVINSTEHGLKIPEKVSTAAYEASTGISTSIGYDPVVNPLAESFTQAFGGTAKLTHDDIHSHMFWTLPKDSRSATVSYTKLDDPQPDYQKSLDFYRSFYGSPVEESDTQSCFYSEKTSELIWLAKGDDWYAQIIITGPEDTTQGELRKDLITYKTKLET